MVDKTVKAKKVNSIFLQWMVHHWATIEQQSKDLEQPFDFYSFSKEQFVLQCARDQVLNRCDVGMECQEVIEKNYAL